MNRNKTGQPRKQTGRPHRTARPRRSSRTRVSEAPARTDSRAIQVGLLALRDRRPRTPTPPSIPQSDLEQFWASIQGQLRRPLSTLLRGRA
jgi:hypothetical protein